MDKKANVRRYNTLKIAISLMYFLDEKRCTFKVSYFNIASFCNLSNLSIAKINSVKFATKIQSPKLVPQNLQLLDLVLGPQWGIEGCTLPLSSPLDRIEFTGVKILLVIFWIKNFIKQELFSSNANKSKNPKRWGI